MAIPIQQQSTVRRAIKAWFDPRGRSTGLIAFALMRLSGIGLVVYLLMHLVVLSTLTAGAQAWDTFVSLAKNPAFLLLDVILIAGILVHMLNGLRVTIVGLGFGTNSHKGMFWTLMAVAVLLAVYAAWLVFTK
jgi:succinate dehydrogenase / fumarate reductase, cytochrome b subunit